MEAFRRRGLRHRAHHWEDQSNSLSISSWLIAWAFLWNRYATINWAAPYAVPAFAVQALLLAWFGGLRDHLHFTADWTGHGVVGLTHLLYAMILHPLVAILAGLVLSLTGTGDYEFEPNGTYYYSSSSGTHSADLEGPGSADFDLYLWKWNGSSWSTVASGTSANSSESVSYSGSAGYYVWRVESYSGSGSYTLCTNKP